LIDICQEIEKLLHVKMFGTRFSVCPLDMRVPVGFFIQVAAGPGARLPRRGRS
jgi:hypothetical protein